MRQTKIHHSPLVKLTRTVKNIVLFLQSICLALIFSSQTFARPLPGVIGEDNRKPQSQNSLPWRAIGQINISGYRKKKFCTGTLIAPNKVLTAAHCLVNLRTLKSVSSHRIHFVAGASNKGYLAHAKAKCFFIKPGYIKAVSDKKWPFTEDLALIILKKHLKINPIAPTIKTPDLNIKALVHASYSGDRRYALTAHKNCRLKKRHKGAWLTDCDTHFGSSGGPVLQKSPTRNHYQLNAVMAGIIVKRYTIAVPIKSWLPFIKSAQCLD